MNFRKFLFLSFVVIFSGCATYAGLNYDELFGKASVQQRTVSHESAQADFFLNEVRPIIDNRCVVCHACYDAPCQLKMSSVEGIDRGASDALVYQGTRLTAAQPTRLFEDAQSTEQWRAFNFHPILNERAQTPTANIQASLISRMLMQKENHPLPDQKQLEGFDFAIDRLQECPSIEEFDNYEQDFPTWGMPYGLPNISSHEYSTLMAWVENGSIMNAPLPLSKAELSKIAEYETFLNKDDLKSQLSARYIYEHLFLSHLYFSELTGGPRYFNLVRSSTPPGEAVQRIVTRRPYDNPGVERVYYRLIPEQGTTVSKTHLPFELNNTRMQDWQAWFVDESYTVTSLPTYQIGVAANPLTAFFDLPVRSRFKFMVDTAQNTIGAFIKGPVCRGQLALNVINDRFWVMFIDPDKSNLPEINEFYQSQVNNLRLPSELDSTTVPVVSWVKYSRQQARYLEAKSTFINDWFNQGEYLTTDILWQGDGSNHNAALTIFRHFDSASVVQGLVGHPPKTAWVLDYALLERIHYLLVAGFDIYGNFGHQLITRMFMDFLRLEGETNFISLLPREVRHIEHSSWYQNQSSDLSDFFQRNIRPFDQQSLVPYQTTDYKNELYDILQTQLGPVLNARYDIKKTDLSPRNERILNSVNGITGNGVQFLPEIIMMIVEADTGEDEVFTLLRNAAHTNISSLFNEESNRDFDNDDLTLVKGIVGSYPSAFLLVGEKEVTDLVKMLSTLKTEEDYIKLLDRFAIRRSDSYFWPFSDRLHAWYQKNQPIEFGLLDYNRFENR
ncbi:fatty acid cis/trans isomerase [Vibrio genomosp. F10]|uniref:fatty acid cis/trans isomerase n=1 Tax=Vibrio genomosp. F10 TaxID=723171 RepID=UPI0002E0F70E|nr:fatty acid cis/trans isomerase [Vibrio genomosp. F10]OEF03707.1 9-hexadecenoic acid cis-trans isomerase [Vibrio genomosp. F10 str. 9ZB36]